MPFCIAFQHERLSASSTPELFESAVTSYVMNPALTSVEPLLADTADVVNPVVLLLHVYVQVFSPTEIDVIIIT